MQSKPALYSDSHFEHLAVTRPSKKKKKKKKRTQLHFSQPEGRDFYVHINGGWDFFFIKKEGEIMHKDAILRN